LSQDLLGRVVKSLRFRLRTLGRCVRRTGPLPLVIVAGSFGGMLAAISLDTVLQPGPFAVAMAFAGGVGTASLFVLSIARKESLVDVGEAIREGDALVNVRPLLGPLPVPIGGWAVDAVFVEAMTEVLMRRRPGLVVECGSGSSTVWIAACLQALGSGRLISLEHDPMFAGRTSALLRTHGLEDRVDLVVAPLRDWLVGERSMPWYGFDPRDQLVRSIDVLVVDGPPGKVGPRARYPALPVLQGHLSQSCSILLDDGMRADERWVAKEWAKELGARSWQLPTGKRGWILERDAGASSSEEATGSPRALMVVAQTVSGGVDVRTS